MTKHMPFWLELALRNISVIKHKPEFLWWAHILMWDTIAKYPIWTSKAYYPTDVKKDVVHKIVMVFPNRMCSTITKDCFACHAVNSSRTPICDRCPLDWGTSKNGTPRLCDGGAGLYSRWASAWMAHDTLLAVELAKEIRDLPLAKHARKFYTIKEFPNGD